MAEDLERILEAGRAIRSRLPDLIPAPDEAEALDRELAAALLADDEDDEAKAARVLGLLTDNHAAAAWTLAFIRDGRPPDFVTRSGGYSPLPGHGTVVGAPRFRCPHGDYVWYRRTSGRRIPVCPTHEVQLVPDHRDVT